MKFSYSLIKKLGARIPAKEKLVELLNLRAFETADLPGDALDISIPANRYSDASSHRGLAVVASAIMGKKAPAFKLISYKSKAKSDKFKISVAAKKACPRYSALYVEVPKVEPSPKWLQEILLANGLRSINVVVDILNYVMLELGQPMHAFDADQVVGEISIRFAKQNERVKAIDEGEYTLTPQDLVIADDKGVLAIAGIRGGKRAEINHQTKRLIIESANFDPAHIYRTSRFLNLFTDASMRFNHGLSPVLVERGIRRAVELLKSVAKAKIGDWVDLFFQKIPKTIIAFDSDQFNAVTGINLSVSACFGYLKNLGFKVTGKMVEAPPERIDINLFQDLAEEVVNLYGYEKLAAKPPEIALIPSGQEDQVVLKDNIRRLLAGFGLNEVYNYSFVSRKDLMKAGDTKWWGAVSLKNPVSDEFAYLRPGLSLELFKNVKDNFRYFDSVRIFELGKTFVKSEVGPEERLVLGLALADKKTAPLLELKGLVDQLLKSLGLVDYFFRDLNMDIKFLEEKQSLRIESGDHQVLGYLGLVKPEVSQNTALAEFYVEKMLRQIISEKEYRPLPKYPAVMRDLSLLVDVNERVGPIQDLLENISHLVEDVDLLDWYQDDSRLGDGKKSLTFRLVFQSPERTLTDDEVGKELEKIIAALQEKFNLEVR